MAKLSLPNPHVPIIEENSNKINEVWYRYLDKNKTEVNTSWLVDAQHDFNAAGDGVKDDTAAIQAWLDSGEPVLYLPAGTYNISTTLTVPSTVQWLFGAGEAAQSLLQWTGGSSTLLEFSASYSGLSFENIQLNKPSGLSNNSAIYLNSSNIVLRNVYISSGGQFGIYVEGGTSNNWIQNCYITDCYSNHIGAYTGSAIELTVLDTTFQGTSSQVSHCVNMPAGTAYLNNYIFRNCKFLGGNSSTNGGLWIRKLAANSRVTGCQFKNFVFDALEVGGDSTGFSIDNNVFVSNRSIEVGLGLECGSGETMTKFIVTGNYVESSGASGIFLNGNGSSGMTYGSVIGNYVLNPQVTTAGGISLADATNCDVIGNVIRSTDGNMKYGIEEVGTADFNRFGANDIHGAVTSDLLILGANTKKWEPVWT